MHTDDTRHTDNFQKIWYEINHMWQEKNQDISMIASEQSHAAIKYQVFVYNEEVKDGRMIILPWKIGKLLVWKTKQKENETVGKAKLPFLIKRRTKHSL